MVSPTESVTAALQSNWDMVDAALEGLDDATLTRQPNEQCNSISWILWHMNRVTDTFVHTRLQDTSQLWVSGGWHSNFGMPEDPDDRGVGWTAAQVAAWSAPPRDVQLGYYEAVKAAARAYLSSASAADMEKTVVFPPSSEPRPVAAALGRMTWDSVAHGGQIAYLRGLFQGMGWHR